MSLGYLIQSQIGYDDLPTQNVTVNNCIFEKGSQSNYPVIIGNDGPLGNVVHDNIHFSNNKINGFDKRAINLFCMQNVFIENNEIIDYSTSDSYFLLANPNLQVNTTNLFVIGNSYKMTSGSKGIFLNIRNYVENPNKNDKWYAYLMIAPMMTGFFVFLLPPHRQKQYSPPHVHPRTTAPWKIE